MGCDDTREDIEEKMLFTRLEREQIRKQKKLLMEELKLSTGHKIKKEKIPDFVDVEYIREKKQINDSDLYKTQNYIFTNKLLMEIKKFVDTIYNNSYIEKY